MQALKKLITRLLREVADKIDGGTCELSEAEAMDIMSVLSHELMSKSQVCSYLQISPSKLGEYIRNRQLPKGKKRVGFKELRWYKDEIDKCAAKMRANKI